MTCPFTSAERKVLVIEPRNGVPQINEEGTGRTKCGCTHNDSQFY